MYYIIISYSFFYQMKMKLNVMAVIVTALFVTVDAFILQDQDNQPDLSEADSIPVEKRGRLSLTADLRSLARMLEAHRKRFIASRFPYDSIRKKLFRYGKRSPVTETLEYNEGEDRSNALDSEFPSLKVEEESPIYNIKRQRLSVNGALSSLADMLAANGRQRMMSEMAMNRQRLFGLGK